MIRESLIFVDSDLCTKEGIIDLISKKAKENNLLNDVNKFKAKVFAREAEISTAVGNEIAIPHGKTNEVKEPFVAFIRAKNAFVWNEISGEKAKLIFLIGVPEKDANKLHLKYIAEISKKLINDEFRTDLLNLKSKKEVFNMLKSINVK